MKIFLNTAPLHNQNSTRGVGVYTRFLLQALQQLPGLEVRDSLDDHFDPDLVHFPFFDLFFPTLPLFKPKTTVVTIHDVIPLLFPDHYQPGKKGVLANFHQRFSLGSVSAVITDSEASRRDIVKLLNVPESRVHTVLLAANPNIRLPISARNELKVKEVLRLLPQNYILYVGDINYNKNIPQLIKAIKYLKPELHLVCVGKNFTKQDIPEWHWISAQVALSDVEKRIHFITDLGEAPESALAMIYQGAVCYVQPSLAEGFGLPVLEAMQCGTPVVCAANSSLLEVGGSVAFFAEAVAESLAAAVTSVLELSSQSRTKTIERGKEWAAEFTWQKTAEATATVYRSVIK